LNNRWDPPRPGTRNLPRAECQPGIHCVS
jgi:hypothetical protein